MNLRRFKTATPAQVLLGERRLTVRPLPRQAIDEAREEARLSDCADDPSAVELWFIVGVVARATGLTLDQAKALYPHQLVEVHRAWSQVQADNAPPADALGAALKLAMLDEAEIVVDGASAFMAPTPSEFYGKPIAELTVGQVSYYSLVRSAFHELHVDNSGRKVSRSWLTKAASGLTSSTS